jgi:peptide/nickel transport system permease protein
VLLNLGADVLYFLANPRLRGLHVSVTPAVLGRRRPGWWPRGRYKAARQLARRPAAIAALTVVLASSWWPVAAPQLAPYDPNAHRLPRRCASPRPPRICSAPTRWGATCSHACSGARGASLLAGVIPVTIAVVLSVPLGLLSGVSGGWLDGLIMRINDAMLSIPFLIVAIALAAFLGPGLGNAMIAIGIAALPTFVRLVRGTVLVIKTEEYVEAARALGCSRPRVALRHILPNTLPPLFVQVSITVAAAIIAEASLSFLGLGQQPPAPSWGSMLNAAQRYLSQAPWMALYPGLMIFGIVMALNVLGDGLRDALDPRHQS